MAAVAQLVECPLRGKEGHRFDPRPRHTKVVKNGTSCSSLITQTYGIELGLVVTSVRIMWLGVVSCQVSGVWYFSEAIKVSIELPAATSVTPLWYDWQIVESDFKPEQTTTTIFITIIVTLYENVTGKGR